MSHTCSKILLTSLPHGKIIKIILGVIGVAGVVAVGATCPNLLQLVVGLSGREYTRRSYYQAVKRLEARGIIAIKRQGERWKFVLTQAGLEILGRYEAGEKKIKIPKVWDGKWRVLIFDIPESKRWQRNRVRQYFIHLGLVRIQKSVWVYPYECHEAIDLVRVHTKLTKEILYLVVEKLDNDAGLRQRFGFVDSKKNEVLKK